jgi:carboxymethylenebutenolidase
MQDALANGNDMAKASEVIVYPESNHAFYADYRPSYNEVDAKDAWSRALNWFKRYLA